MSYQLLNILAKNRTPDQMSRIVPSSQILRYKELYQNAIREYRASKDKTKFNPEVFSKWEQLLNIPNRERLKW
ncbi:MAG: hypothetical protein AABX11_06850 [Nanoarchaeota archaeon]